MFKIFLETRTPTEAFISTTLGPFLFKIISPFWILKKFEVTDSIFENFLYLTINVESNMP